MDSAEPSARADRHITLMISGMTCAGCARSVERILSAVPGVARVEVDLAGGRAVVEATAPAEALADAIEGRGYGVRLVS